MAKLRSQILFAIIFYKIVTYTVSAVEPPRDRLHGSCWIYLNEVFIPTGPGDIIVEIGKYCPDSATQASRFRKALTGYQVIILKGKENVRIHSKNVLEGSELVHTCPGTMEPPMKKPKVEPSPPTVTASAREPSAKEIEVLQKFRPIAPKVEFDEAGVKHLTVYIPSMNPPSTTTEQSTLTPAPPPTASKAVSGSSEGRWTRQCATSVVALFSFRVWKPYIIEHEMYSVALLYYGDKERKRKQHINSLRVGDPSPNFEEIRAHLADVIVYGRVWQDDIPNYINEVARDSGLLNQNFVFLPSKNNDRMDAPDSFRSISRCDKSGNPFKPTAYKYAPVTEGELNLCDERSNFILPDYSMIDHPFSFKGAALLPQCKKLIVNIKSSLDLVQQSEAFQALSSAMKTAALTNLHYHTVLRVTKTYQEDNFPTGPKERHYVSHIQQKLEKHGTKIIPGIIASFYAENKSPDLDEIYQKFVTKIREKELSAEKDMGPVVESDESVPPLFSCSKETFRRMLHRLGYVYGKLNTRSIVLQDPRIVQLRGKYLNRIRQNDQAFQSLQVVYLDETWIDPYARRTYGWRPRHCFSMAEAAKYTYQKSKVGRGPRLIVLAAGGLGGMVKDVTEVYPVAKGSPESTNDYHSNIHGEKFALWFEKLLDKLDEDVKGKYLIVLDNAPYHTVSIFPSKSKNKPELIAFLTKMKNEDKLDGIPFHENMRKWELVDAIDKLKEKMPYRRIDVMAAERGHEVVRLPPYNCDLNPIEMVWSFMKRKLRKENREQDINIMRQKAEIILNSITAEKWKPYVAHVKKLEKEYWENDGHFDKFLDRNPDVIIPDAEDGDEYESDDYEADECEAESCGYSEEDVPEEDWSEGETDDD